MKVENKRPPQTAPVVRPPEQTDVKPQWSPPSGTLLDAVWKRVRTAQPRLNGPEHTGLKAQAEELRNSGALGTGEAPKPPLSDAERNALNEIVAKANDDTAVALSQNPKAMSGATPEQKAKLIATLMSGSTSDTEDRAIASILQSCTSKAEYEKVLALAGGKKQVFGELDDKAAKNTLAQLDGKWEKEQQAATGKAISLLEQCQSPEEAKEIAASLGGPELKHQIKDPEQLKRLDAVSKRFEMPALGYGMPPEAVQQKRASINQAITKEDSGLATKLAEDKDAMKVASPSEKAGLIKELMRGWTKDRQDVAVYKILASCTSKAEFDEVMQLAGGREVLKDMDHAETRTKMNELFGAWDRVDLADDKQRASQFRNVMADPQKQAELSATRPPTPGEVNQVGAAFNVDPKDANDPAMQQASQAAGAVRQNIQNKAFDVDWDPQAKTELVLEQRRREVEGKPKLDFTSLTAEADKITSHPDFNKNVAEFQKQYNNANAFDKLDDKEAREKYVTHHMEKIAKQHGISEQTMKALVTQRMGQIYNEGAGEMSKHSQAITGQLKAELESVEKTRGTNSPEASALRERIAKVEGATGAYTNHLASVGEVYKDMFPVPASFWEGFVSAFSFISDIAAAVASCIPGVGQALGAAYFGVKAITAAARGDVLGVFSSVASALPGVGSAIGGAAGAAVKTAGRAMQTGIGVGTSVAEGNVLGVIGSVAGAGAGVSPVLDYAQRGAKLADGISRGDVSAIAGAAGGLLGPLSHNPAVQGIVQNPVVQGVAQATDRALPFVNAVASGDLGRALGAAGLHDGAAFVDALRTGDYGRALGQVGSSLERMANGPEAGAVVRSIGQVSDVLGALGSGNLRPIAGALHDIAGGSLSSAFAGVSAVAGSVRSSDHFQAAMDLTAAGSRFFNSVGSGDLAAALRSEDANLSGLLESAQPLVQALASGDYGQAMEHLRKSPLTAAAADSLSLFDPLADLVQKGWLESLQQSAADMDRMVHVGHELDRFKALEEAARQIEKRFGSNINDMAEHLLDRSGYAVPPAGLTGSVHA